MAKKYDESSIKRFAGLLGIRKKPTPYIGPTDSDGLWTCWREPSDNTVDQALAGRNNLTHLIVDKEKGRYWTVDAGPGIPVGKKAFEDERGRSEKLSVLYVVTGLTHAGANFDSDVISRGTHGIGQKATNAMSKKFTVWTFRDKAWWCIEYRDAKLHKAPYKTKAPKLPHGIKVKKGTVTLFEPDMKLFQKGSKIDLKVVETWCQLTAYLVKGLTLKLTDSKGKTKSFVSKGPADFLKHRIEENKVEPFGKPLLYSSREADVAIAFTNYEGADNVECYTNGLRNKEGGEHLRALYDALVKSLVPYKGKAEYTPSDLREGLIGLVNYKIAAPKFNNQPKDKLIDERVYDVAYPQLLKAFEELWKYNKTFAKEVVARASELRKKTADFLKDKKLSRNVKAAQKKLPAKLAGVVGNRPIDEREIYLVEGDSAGGTAHLARFKDFQAVFALKGKPLNVMEAAKDKVNSNNEVAGILAGIGIDPSHKNPLSRLGYGKIIFLADPDVDGKHINALLLGLFWKYAPSLYKDGKIFMLASPEYMAEHKGQYYFGDTPADVVKQIGKEVKVQHIKGWGEIDEGPMRAIAFQVGRRRLYKIEPPTDKKGAANFVALLGKDPTYRKRMLGLLPMKEAA